MSLDGFPPVLLKEVVNEFEDLIGRFGKHAVAAGELVYVQPSVYLSSHLVCMRAAGWTDIDFDELAAVSGTSALFAYHPSDFMPKYANLLIGMDKRIADATGFGYEWVEFNGVEGAWDLLKESIDSSRPVKGWHWENVLFAGYRDATNTADRKVFAMADGPETFAKWWTWHEFDDWVELVEGCGCPQLGRHTKRARVKPAKEIALRVLRDLVEWSTDPPSMVREKYPSAAFGLAGIKAYAEDVADIDAKPKESFKETAWLGCHAINPQWMARNSTAVYLARLAGTKALPDEVNQHLLAASREYKAAYTAWQKFYQQLGHAAPDNAWNTKRHRRAGAIAVHEALQHERAAIEELKEVLAAAG